MPLDLFWRASHLNLRTWYLLYIWLTTWSYGRVTQCNRPVTTWLSIHTPGGALHHTVWRNFSKYQAMITWGYISYIWTVVWLNKYLRGFYLDWSTLYLKNNGFFPRNDATQNASKIFKGLANIFIWTSSIEIQQLTSRVQIFSVISRLKAYH